jgi:LPXTG-site transpeptidase (sortase) family protein
MSTKVAGNLPFWLFLIFSLVSLLSASTLLYFRYGISPLSFDGAPKITNNTSIIRRPIQLEIKRLRINLLVETQEVNTSVWPETDRGVTFVKGSATPGQIGNSIFYGHNWTNLLGRLPGARIGDEVTITMDSGIVKTFVITKTKVVSPNDTEVLDDTNFSRITLYTCTGFLDSKRFVAFAQPKI